MPHTPGGEDAGMSLIGRGLLESLDDLGRPGSSSSSIHTPHHAPPLLSHSYPLAQPLPQYPPQQYRKAMLHRGPPGGGDDDDGRDDDAGGMGPRFQPDAVEDHVETYRRATEAHPGSSSGGMINGHGRAFNDYLPMADASSSQPYVGFPPPLGEGGGAGVGGPSSHLHQQRQHQRSSPPLSSSLPDHPSSSSIHSFLSDPEYLSPPPVLDGDHSRYPPLSPPYYPPSQHTLSSDPLYGQGGGGQGQPSQHYPPIFQSQFGGPPPRQGGGTYPPPPLPPSSSLHTQGGSQQQQQLMPVSVALSMGLPVGMGGVNPMLGQGGGGRFAGGGGGGGGGGGRFGPRGADGPSTNTSGGRQDPDEEISTIFVVGFPDDMQEREFQNMFTFCKDFEAATLKLPPPSATAPPTSVSIGGGIGDNPNFYFPQPYSLDPSAAVFDIYGEPPSAFLSQAASLGGGGLNAGGAPVPNSSGGASLPPRRQIIGFAKFKTRQAALDARDVLQGRKVDVERASVLKAEMAKKNLHTRRGVGGEDAVGGGIGPSGPPAGNQQTAGGSAGGQLGGGGASGSVTGGGAGGALGLGVGGAGGGVSGSALSRGRLDGYGSGQQPPSGSVVGPADWTSVGTLGVEGLGGGPSSSLSQGSFPAPFPPLPFGQPGPFPPSFVSRRESDTSPPPSSPRYGSSQKQSSDLLQQQQQQPPPSIRATQPPDWSHPASRQTLQSPPSQRAFTTAASSSEQTPRFIPDDDLPSSVFSPIQSGSFRQQQQQQKQAGGASQTRARLPQQQQQQQPPSTPGSSGFRPFAMERSGGRSEYSRGGEGDDPADTDESRLPSRDDSQQQQQQPESSLASASSSLGKAGAEKLRALPRTSNPADMNPPINTLYVGNLPTSPPPTHPPSHLEDALRALFQRREGFHRMSFRQKSNGPMCFVEFNDVESASKALKELYGETLNGFVKGGIRLSYSKHPLGQRGPASSGTPTASASPAQGGHIGGGGLGGGGGSSSSTSAGASSSSSHTISSPPVSHGIAASSAELDSSASGGGQQQQRFGPPPSSYQFPTSASSSGISSSLSSSGVLPLPSRPRSNQPRPGSSSAPSSHQLARHSSPPTAEYPSSTFGSSPASPASLTTSPRVTPAATNMMGGAKNGAGGNSFGLGSIGSFQPFGSEDD